MSIHVTCNCGQQFRAQPHLYGKRVACPSCGSPLDVPTPRPTATAGGSIPVACRCGSRFNAQPHLAGKRVACPNCAQTIVVPTARVQTPTPTFEDEQPGLDLASLPVPTGSNYLPAANYTHQPTRRTRKPLNPLPLIIGGIILAGAAVLGFAAVAAWNGVSNAIADWKKVDWQEHDAGPYKITFPYKPRENRMGLGPSGWKAGRGRLTCGIIHTPIPSHQQLGPDWRRETLEKALEIGYTEQGGSLASQQDIDFHGCPGKACVYDVTIRGIPAKIHARLYVIRGNIYNLDWIVPADNPRQEEMTRFFDSLVVKGVNDQEVD